MIITNINLTLNSQHVIKKSSLSHSRTHLPFAYRGLHTQSSESNGRRTMFVDFPLCVRLLCDVCIDVLRLLRITNLSLSQGEYSLQRKRPSICAWNSLFALYFCDSVTSDTVQRAVLKRRSPLPPPRLPIMLTTSRVWICQRTCKAFAQSKQTGLPGKGALRRRWYIWYK